MLDPEEVEEILLLLDSADVDELHLRTRRFELSLSRGPDGWSQSLQVLPADHTVDGTVIRPPDAASTGESSTGESSTGGDAGAAADGAATVAGTPVENAGLVDVPAPLVGTFYRAPRPGAPPFVEVGSDVGSDTVVGIVETMKLMTSVLAGVDGRVAEICRADAQLVEQGAVLMRVKPAP